MGWLAFAIALIAIVYFAIHYSGFRQFLAGLVALAVLVWAYFQYEDYRRERRIAVAKRNISTGQIALQDAKLSLGISKRVTGSILNQSRYQISRIKLHVTVRDCASTSQQTACNVIGDEVVSVYVDVPAGQKRGFDSYISLYNLPKVEEWSWNGYISDFTPVVN